MEKRLAIMLCPFCSSQEFTQLPESTIQVTTQGGAKVPAIRCGNSECPSRQFVNHAIVIILHPTDI